MQKNLRKIGIIIAVILAIAAIIWLFDSRQKRAEEDLKDQFNQLALKYAPAKRDTIRDSIKVITQQVLMMPPKEYKSYAIDRQLLKDINLQVKQIVADQRTVVITADSVKVKRRGHIYNYSDAWLNFQLNTADSILTYKARDSLQTIIARQFKHKFLFWKWGTKGYQVKVINFNPHSSISYNNYIQVTE